MCIGFNVKQPLFLSYFRKDEFSPQIFEKSSNMNYGENPVSGSRYVADGQTIRQSKLLVAFRNFANALKNHEKLSLFPQER
jgi:hypothetical protein